MTLGAEAGAAIAQMWLDWDLASRAVPVYDRTLETSPLLEVAKYLLHKLGGIEAVLKMMADYGRGKFEDTLTRASKRLDKPFTSLVYFMKTPLP